MSEIKPEIAERHMRRALELASLGGYRVHPNPKVGCVIARGETVVVEGYHQEYGTNHAERNALEALEKLQLSSDEIAELTMFVTLEPCSHHGNTPPCVQAILDSGIRRVYVAQRDPNPIVDGRGLDILNSSGIELHVGLLEKEARRLNAAFNKFMTTTRPLVIAKWAMSLDGKIAAYTGDSKWISGPESRKRVHEIRGHVDAVVVGVGTALADNPRLTRRGVEGRDPARVIVDSRCRCPFELGLIATARDIKTYLFCTELADIEKRKALRKLGVNVIVVPTEGKRVDVNAMLDEMGRRGWHSILVEGGGELLGSFFAHDLVDHIYTFIAPKIIGGDAPGPTRGQGFATVAEALPGQFSHVERFGDDLMVHCQIKEW